MKCLFVVPHPDDLELSCGILVQKLISSEHRIKVIIVNSGELAGDPAEREQEALASCRILGVDDVSFLRYPQFKMPENRWDVKESLESVVHKFVPDMLFVPWHDDTHEDHASIADIAMVAGRSVKTVYFYPTPSSIGFVPDTIVVGTRHMLDQKIKAVSEHKTQLNTGRIDLENVEITSRYWLHNFGHHRRNKLNGVDISAASAEVYKLRKQELEI